MNPHNGNRCSIDYEGRTEVYLRADIHEQLEGQDPALLKMTSAVRTSAAELNGGIAWLHVC